MTLLLLQLLFLFLFLPSHTRIMYYPLSINFTLPFTLSLEMKLKKNQLCNINNRYQDWCPLSELPLLWECRVSRWGWLTGAYLHVLLLPLGSSDCSVSPSFTDSDLSWLIYYSPFSSMIIIWSWCYFILSLMYRGRMNVLHNFFQKPLKSIINMFSESEPSELGDVKYHLGESVELYCTCF